MRIYLLLQSVQLSLAEGKAGIVRDTSMRQYYMVSNVSKFGGFRFIAFVVQLSLAAQNLILLHRIQHCVKRTYQFPYLVVCLNKQSRS